MLESFPQKVIVDNYIILTFTPTKVINKKENIMKNFKVTSLKGNSVIVESNSKESAKQIGMKALGYTMRGEFFPLHWSEISSVNLVK